MTLLRRTESARSAWIVLIVAGVLALIYPPRLQPPRGERCKPPAVAIVMTSAGRNEGFADIACPRVVQPRLLGGAALLLAGLTMSVASGLTRRQHTALALAVAAFGIALVVSASQTTWASSDSPCGSVWTTTNSRGVCGALEFSNLIALAAGALSAVSAGSSLVGAHGRRRVATSP